LGLSKQKIDKMAGETSLEILLKTLEPCLNEGDYVFCHVDDVASVNQKELIFYFKEKEAITIVVRKEFADENKLEYSTIMAWITLTVHSSLDAVGLTAAFSTALAKESISCNVVAGFYHDHIFVAKKDTVKTMDTLGQFANK
jgi:uncharacterized protein